MTIRRILVPVDFSDSSAAAVRCAIELARAFGAEIHLLHSYQINPGGMVPYGPVFPDNFFEALRAAAAEQLGKVYDEVKSAGIEAKMHLSQEVPASAIADAAKQLSADLIVMGTRGLTGLKHILLGSVAERTVRMAECPVMTVSEQPS